MQKDFDKWNSKKIKVDVINKRPFFHIREIWFCYLGKNVGFEQDGDGEDFLRPVLIIKKFNNEIFWGIPLTKSEKPLSKKIEKYYVDFSFIEGVKSRAILSQVRLIDAKRLAYILGEIDEDSFKNVKQKLKDLLP